MGRHDYILTKTKKESNSFVGLISIFVRCTRHCLKISKIFNSPLKITPGNPKSVLKTDFTYKSDVIFLYP